jgi:hypothetical protein
LRLHRSYSVAQAGAGTARTRIMEYFGGLRPAN